MPPLILAHVRYVTPPVPSPDPLRFLLGVLGNPGHLLLLGAGGLAVLLVVGTWARWRPLEGRRLAFIARAEGYWPFVPWMLRLSGGLLLLGAGTTRVLFAPDVAPEGLPYILLTAIGFFLLLGVGVRVAAAAGLVIYAIGLWIQPALVEIWDVTGALAAVVVAGAGRPSLDDLLRTTVRTPPDPSRDAETEVARHHDLVALIVRLGLGGSLLASGVVDKLLVYNRALDTVAHYHLTSVIPVDPGMWVIGAALVESGLGLVIIAGLLTRASAILAFLVLTLALFGLPDDPVIAHVGLFGLSSVLVVTGGGRWSVDAILRRVDPWLRRSAPELA
ncbi:MAG TPA: DoxX family protein [Candidatus Limnocylindria bacterium]|nr:DoxX family protein [Candidatus Limnocylindria bacterium]